MAAAQSVPLAFVPGILASSEDYRKLLPGSCRLVPCDHRPAGEQVQAPGDFGDYLGIAALRLLTSGLRLGAAGDWALGGHSAGGTALYQCLDLLGRLQAPGGAEELLREAGAALSAADLGELSSALLALEGQPARLPRAAISMEGSLLPCDALGWAEDWAASPEPPEGCEPDPRSGWTWEMAKLCSGSLVARCGAEPPRHLASIERWLLLENTPGLVYIAGEFGAAGNGQVLPALRSIAGDSSLLRTVEIKGASHDLVEAPASVRRAIAAALGAEDEGAKPGWPPQVADALSTCLPCLPRLC